MIVASHDPQTEKPPPLDREQFKEQVLLVLPQLRAFARSLCGNRDLADDLVQESLMRAWASRHTFTPGSNFKAWLFIILRNRCYSTMKRSARYVSCEPEMAERMLVAQPTQHVGIELADVQRALDQLPAEQREMLMLIASGVSYEQAAEIAQCAMGTVKSRIARGRTALRRLLAGDDAEDDGLPETTTASDLDVSVAMLGDS